MHISRSAAVVAVIVGASTVVLTGGTAHAASFSLSVSAIDRTGANATDLEVHAVNVKNDDEYDFTSGETVRVPAGTYSVGTMIRSADETWTLAVRMVTVSQATNVAFDAREGRRVSFTVDEPTAVTRTMQLVPLVKVDSSLPVWALSPLHGSVPVGETYVIPAKSKYLSLIAFGHLEKRGSTYEQPSPYRFDLAHRVTGGMPEDVSFSDKRADLADVSVTVRSAGPGEEGELKLYPAFPDTGTQPASGYTHFPTLPAQITSYRTPGIFWRTDVLSFGTPGSGGVDTHFDSHPIYEKGHSSETYRSAAWGPNVDTDIDGRYLWISPQAVLTAPGYGGWLDAGGGRSVKLYRGSTLLGQSAGKDLKVKLPTKTATYTMKVTTARASADGLSAKTSATWKFKARGYSDGTGHGGARILTARFTPKGLDAANTAARGSTTSVGLKFGYSSMKAVAVEASFDGGTTWKKVTATRSGSSYVVRVANPGTAGAVSLRVKATESKGSSISQTILNTYGVR